MGTYLPGRPVNCSATKNGCERNLWILRARVTVSLASSDSSSMPRMALMSCRSLWRCSTCLTARATLWCPSPRTPRPRTRDERRARVAAGRLGHMSVNQRGSRLLGLMHVDDAALLELQPQVVPLARALADGGEDRDADVLHGDVVDQLLDDDGLADARAAEQPDLAAAQVRVEKVDDLDARLEHLQLGRLILERRGRPVDGPALLRVDRPIREVDRLAEDVHDAPQRRRSDRPRDGRPRIPHLHAPAHPVRFPHPHRPPPLPAP